jgi:sugar transferase EpsL
MKYELSKRLFDLLWVFPALFVSSPLMMIIAVLIRLSMGRPVILCQVRVGRHGRPFVLYKFRTMIESRDKWGALLPDGERVTVFGAFLRATSLDEIPGFFNVLKGDMSLVGPRPHLIRDLHLYTKAQDRRHEARPGMTGWAQVNGRNAISLDERFRLDVWYVDNRSLRLDVKIIAMTMIKVLRREGIVPLGGKASTERQ